MDKRSLDVIATLHPSARPKITAFLEEAQGAAEKQGLLYIAISGLRSWEEQEALYAKGRTAPGRIVTNARPGSSMHNFGLAADFGVFQSNGKTNTYLDGGTPAQQRVADKMHREAAVIGKRHGLRWGGDFRSIYDAPHFELDVPHTVAELAQMRKPNQWVVLQG
jgi:peptidoglycan L-alanyl-D-glutamate endopeptidase CwlK